MLLQNTDFLDEDREGKITLLFESILHDLGYRNPIIINSIERAILSPEGEIISGNFFDLVHSELERKNGVIDGIRAVIVSIGGKKVLIAHEAKSMNDISHIDTGSFERVITARDIHETGKIENFQGYVRDIIEIERAMRRNYGITSLGRDTLSRKRVESLLRQEVAE